MSEFRFPVELGLAQHQANSSPSSIVYGVHLAVDYVVRAESERGSQARSQVQPQESKQEKGTYLFWSFNIKSSPLVVATPILANDLLPGVTER